MINRFGNVCAADAAVRATGWSRLNWVDRKSSPRRLSPSRAVDWARAAGSTTSPLEPAVGADVNAWTARV